MAGITSLGQLQIRTVSPDELAMLARFAIKHGLASAEDAPQVRKYVRALMPVLRIEQRAMLIDAIPDDVVSWHTLRAELLAAE